MISPEIFNNINCDEHYLRKVSVSFDRYVQNLLTVLKDLESNIEAKEMAKLIDEKLQVALQKFDENQYIQAASELTVMSRFLRQDNVELMYENVISPPKNVDFTIKINDLTCNVEVKCPEYKSQENEEGKIRVGFTNRAPTLEEKENIADIIAEKLSVAGLTTVEEKNDDNKLKDYLISTQSKVLKSSVSDVNVLVVCCGDALHMHRWREHLIGSMNGYFTNHSLYEHRLFNRVDYVLLTNIHNRHHEYYNSALITDHWELDKSFNLLYPNIYSTRNKKLVLEKDLEKMNEIFPNENIEFERYIADKHDVPPGSDLDVKSNVMGVAWYADKFKKNGIYYFK